MNVSAVEAKPLIRSIADGGSVTYNKKKLKKHGLTVADAYNVLRGGHAKEPEWENGEWRHQVHTGAMVVVVHIENEKSLRVITGWRKR